MRRVFTIAFFGLALVALSITSVSAGETADMAAATNKLVNKTISTISYENADLADVVKEIARAADVSIIVSKEVKDAGFTVSLDLTNLKASTVLKIVLEEHDLRLQFSHGVFFVRTKEEAEKKATVTTHVYDIRDIVMRIKNFKAPEITLASDDNKRISTPEDEDEKEPPSEEEVLELVENHVEPDLWGTGKHRISVFRKQLVVATSAEVHRKVADFLGQLRATR